MTPEEKFNQEIWWILQEIRKEQLSTPKGEKVEFSLRKPSKYSRKADDSLPTVGTQRKLLQKLKEWKVLDLEPTGFFVDDIFTPPTAYLLTIRQSKFNEFYRLYESGGSYLENKKATPETKNSQSIIRPKSLELIARKIGDLETGTNLINFLTDCGVDKKLIEYPQTKWRMVYTILFTLAISEKPKDQEALFKIIEEAVHPLRLFGGDEERALQMQDLFSSFLQYDGYCIHNGKVVKSTPEILQEIKTRIKERKKEQVSQTTDSGLIPTREPFHIVIDKIKKDIGIRGFEEKVILQKPKNKRIQLRRFPKDLKWEEITMQFLNGHEVIITARNDTFQTNYDAMGFQDEKRKLPNKQWEFLKGLSETSGELSWKSSRATPKGKKQKQLLAETLKAYFQIDEDPFYSYKQEKSYKIRIKLIPEANSTANTKEKEIYEDEKDDLGIKEYRKEQSPEVYEE